MGAPESSPVQQVCETNVRGNCRNRRSGLGAGCVGEKPCQARVVGWDVVAARHNPVARGHAGHREACGLHGPGRHVCSKACGEPQHIGQAAVALYLCGAYLATSLASVAGLAGEQATLMVEGVGRRVGPDQVLGAVRSPGLNAAAAPGLRRRVSRSPWYWSGNRAVDGLDLVCLGVVIGEPLQGIAGSPGPHSRSHGRWVLSNRES
jgi:hypothetical protein